MKRMWLIAKTMPVDFFMALCDRFDFYIEENYVVMKER